MDKHLPGLPETNNVTQTEPATAARVAAIAATLAQSMLDGGLEAANDEPITPIERETRSLQALAEQHELQLAILPNRQAGYVVRMPRTARVVSAEHQFEITYKKAWEGPDAQRPVIAIDADDSLFAYTATKQSRRAALSRFARNETGQVLPADLLTEIMTMTDAFARWQDSDQDIEMYHVEPHQWALSYAISQLKDVAPEDMAARLRETRSTFNKIRRGLHADGAMDQPARLPFRFQGGELVLHEFTPSAGVTSIFEPLLDPQPYPDALTLMQTVAEAGAHSVIFTYGEPAFQLEKLLRLRDKLIASGSGWPYEYVFLTKKSKGTFMKDLVTTSMADPKLRSDLLAPDTHIFMLIDDDQKQTTDFLASSPEVAAGSGARACVVRSVREGTKTWDRRHDAYVEHPEMGRVVHEKTHEGVFIASNLAEFATQAVAPFAAPTTREQYQANRRAYDQQKAHRDAFSNLQLRVYNTLGRALSALAKDQDRPELASTLARQRDYFISVAWDIERNIELTNGLDFMSL